MTRPCKLFSCFLLVALGKLCDGFVFPVPKVATSTKSTLTPANLIPDTSSPDILDTVSSLLADAPEAGGVSYSKASYYTVLGLYLFSFPGLWSTIKRSTKAKIKRKTYVTPGENASGGKSLRQQAGEIMACKLRKVDFLSDKNLIKDALTLCYLPHTNYSTRQPLTRQT